MNRIIRAKIRGSQRVIMPETLPERKVEGKQPFTIYN
jgi:hypothetical protein